MKNGLINTQDWTLEDIEPYGRDITACMKKLVDRFPTDATLKSLMSDILSGSLQLWCMFVDDDIKGIVITEIKTVPATGHKSAMIVGLSGEGLELCENIGVIEAWAKDKGCNDILPVGRRGWEKIISKHGYSVDRVIFRKELA